MALVVRCSSASRSGSCTVTVTWLVAWVMQFYGHHVEGAKPSFSDDLIFLLIGPLFVQEKFFRLIRTGSL